MNSIRKAILKAADHIEVSPDYRFWAFVVPEAECGTPACMLGWIGFFLGMTAGSENNDVKRAIANGHEWNDFYDVLSKMTDHGYAFESEPIVAAKALRLYADKYHPEPKATHTGIPSSVRELFNQPVQA